ncbi:MAG: RHS repeat-associated core domain-containing protein [Clostridia bacterium]|nr:RHS repeat-associated core domain-containing protein [Clostridia bacterium]
MFLELLDFQGNTVVKYVYDAWGNHTVTDYTEFGLGNINPIRYRSYYYDIETGLYYLKSRYYDPKTGRFISMDSTDYLDPNIIGGANLYAYCNNNPVMYADPTGKSASVVFLVIGIIATVIIAAGGVVGGVAAYQTGENVGEGVLKGAIGANFISAGISLIASSFYVPGGVFGVLGSSLFGYGAGLILDTLEIAVLQGRKSAMAGDGFWQGTNKVINAITSNWAAIVFGKDDFFDTTVYGTDVFSAIDQSVDFFRYVGNISQYWKYSRAFKIGMSEYWSKNIGWFEVLLNGADILDNIVDIYYAVTNDPNKSKYFLY